VDEAIPCGIEAFATIGRVVAFDGRDLRPPALRDADVLVLRSVTRVDAAFLRAAPRLVALASPTIGLDHVDAAALDAYRLDHGRPVPLFGAPGSTAGGVADFAVAAIVAALADRGVRPREASVGVWGFGACGSALAWRLGRLGSRVVACDPPLEERSAGAFRSASIEDLLACDAVSLHVPLTTPAESRWPTLRMVDAGVLRALGGRPAVLVNTSRGAVVDGAALLAAVRAGLVVAAVDVWDGEPLPDPDLVAACRLATPHAAGSVIEGRLRATAMVQAAVAGFLGSPARWKAPAPGPRPSVPAAPGPADERVLVEAVGIEALSREFRSAYLSAAPSGRAAAFDRVRAGAMRHEVDWSVD
jgi:erythronate-4-phosphate dehydrogenase